MQFRKIKNNRTITLTVAGHERDIEAPDFVGLTLRNAEIEINKFDLKLDTVMYEYNPNIKEGLITY